METRLRQLAEFLFYYILFYFIYSHKEYNQKIGIKNEKNYNLFIYLLFEVHSLSSTS
jgi:hypothetical protein